MTRLVFIVPAPREYFEETSQLGWLKPSIDDLKIFLAKLKQELRREAPELAVQEVDVLLNMQVKFYSFPLLPSKEESQEIYLEFQRLFHPLSTTSIAVHQGKNGAAHGYLYIETAPDLFRWIWLGKKFIARVLEIIASMREKNLLEQINVLAPSDARS